MNESVKMSSSRDSLRREVWTIANRRFDLSWPANMDALLDDPETHRRFARDEYMPYWAQPWPASVLLAEAVLSGPPGEGRAAVEIGCGIGLVSIAAAMRDWSVVATDYDPEAIAFARLNAERSGVRLHDARVLDYREPSSEQYDLIVASDLLYERKKAEPVARWIASALKPDGVAFVSDPNRTAADGFDKELVRSRLAARVDRVETMSPAGLQIKGRIWRMTRAKAPHGRTTEHA
jgi:predicted nicotinamide N-methyase